MYPFTSSPFRKSIPVNILIDLNCLCVFLAVPTRISSRSQPPIEGETHPAALACWAPHANTHLRLNSGPAMTWRPEQIVKVNIPLIFSLFVSPSLSPSGFNKSRWPYQDISIILPTFCAYGGNVIRWPTYLCWSLTFGCRVVDCWDSHLSLFPMNVRPSITCRPPNVWSFASAYCYYIAVCSIDWTCWADWPDTYPSQDAPLTTFGLPSFD